MPTHDVALLGLWAVWWWSGWPHREADDDWTGTVDVGSNVVAP